MITVEPRIFAKICQIALVRADAVTTNDTWRDLPETGRDVEESEFVYDARNGEHDTGCVAE